MDAMDQIRDQQGWGARIAALAWLRRLFRLRRRNAAVWAITPDGKLIRL